MNEKQIKEKIKKQITEKYRNLVFKMILNNLEFFKPKVSRVNSFSFESGDDYSYEWNGKRIEFKTVFKNGDIKNVSMSKKSFDNSTTVELKGFYEYFVDKIPNKVL